MVFADAVHFVHNVHPGTVYARKGQRPQFACNSGRRRYSVLGGYSSLTGEYVGVAVTGSVNAQTVIAFIKALEAAFCEAERITVFVDNARYFHARLVKAYLLGKRVCFIFLPAYSPNLNLIERLWKFCKKKVLSRYYAHFETFTQAVDAFFAHLDRYRDELGTLMIDHFEIFNSA
jgi:transposase